LNDLQPDEALARSVGGRYVDREELLRASDVVTLHVPLTPLTRSFLGRRELDAMKDDAVVLNTSRGGIVDEEALADWLRTHPGAAAAVDVFCEEPYAGPLRELDNAVLTCHMGASSRDCRRRMETEATREVLRYFAGEPLSSPVPEAEYELQAGAAEARR
jgi:D-3-phosphoglycerate dehydrogenase